MPSLLFCMLRKCDQVICDNAINYYGSAYLLLILMGYYLDMIPINSGDTIKVLFHNFWCQCARETISKI